MSAALRNAIHNTASSIIDAANAYNGFCRSLQARIPKQREEAPKTLANARDMAAATGDTRTVADADAMLAELREVMANAKPNGIAGWLRLWG